MTLPRSLRRRARGVSLIEVLVSLVILSVGVLAVVGLQLVSKRNNADAGQRSIAAQLAYDMAERMRANASTAILPSYLIGTTSLPAGVRWTSGTPPAACTTSAPCTPAATAARDLYEWELSLNGAAEGGGAGGLVSPLACIRQSTSDGGGDGIYMITIAWRGTVQIPDSGTGEACGRVGQQGNPAGAPLYGDNNEYRRVVTLPIYITARRAS
jgi:type IV pilus assembly protein PilV